MEARFDTIIVGAGSAGCVLAHRLSADPGHRVLLLEAGGEDNSALIHMPMGLGKTLLDPALSWHVMTEPDPGNAGQPRAFMRGKVIGGSSSVNGMVYCRGQPEDYDGWAAMGCSEFAWPAMRQAFRQIEDHVLGDDGERGSGGPLHVGLRPADSALDRALLTAIAAQGIPVRQDINRPQQEGVGPTPVTLRAGRRVSAADAFLHPVRRRPNLTVVTAAQVQRVLFEGERAIGVEGLLAGRPQQWRCDGEVILCAGTLHSPMLLMHSGIGPAAQLRQHGIAVRVDSPEVGHNLREHKTVSLQLRLRPGHGINGQLHGWRMALSALRYLAGRRGALAATYDLNAFIRTQPGLEQPDAQVLFWGLTLDRKAADIAVEREAGLLMMGYPLRTESAGQVSLASADPTAPPRVQTNFLSHRHDCEVTLALLRWMRTVAAHPALSLIVVGETHPGAELVEDAQILDAARRDETCQHAVGTCRMGVDARSVLDQRLRVRGVTGLRVVDLSAMPTQVSGNTNGPVMALAWRAADLIEHDRRHPRQETLRAAPSAAVPTA